MDIQWPAIIKHESHCELIHLEDAQSLNELIKNTYLPITNKDYLIDTQGHQFTIKPVKSSFTFTLIKTCDIDLLNKLLKAHLADAGQCCISKFHVTNYQDAIDAVKLMD